MNPLLDFEISVDYRTKPGVLRNVSMSIAPGEIVGLVGQSGSGKSTLSMAILRLLDRNSSTIQGRATFKGRDLLTLSESEFRRIRGKEIALVLQSPMLALNPNLRVGRQLEEAWRCHDGARIIWPAHLHEVLESVSLPADEAFLRKYPHQLSVGLAQRVLIGMAILHRPALLIADEPLSALDAITQSEILTLFSTLSRKLEMAILFVSHDLPSVAALCDRVAVLDGGEIVETGTTTSIFESPRHPFTQKLVAAIPGLPARARQREDFVA